MEVLTRKKPLKLKLTLILYSILNNYICEAKFHSGTVQGWCHISTQNVVSLGILQISHFEVERESVCSLSSERNSPLLSHSEVAPSHVFLVKGKRAAGEGNFGSRWLCVSSLTVMRSSPQCRPALQGGLQVSCLHNGAMTSLASPLIPSHMLPWNTGIVRGRMPDRCWDLPSRNSSSCLLL